LGKNGYAIYGITEKLVGDSGFTNICDGFMASTIFWNNE
jgi:hypothetical protein